MSNCIYCARARMFMSQMWSPEEIEKVFNTPHLFEEPPTTEADIKAHNKRIAESALEPIAVPKAEA